MRQNENIQKMDLRFCVRKSIETLVGETGFEPATPCSQGRCAARLRYSPQKYPIYHYKGGVASSFWALSLVLFINGWHKKPKIVSIVS